VARFQRILIDINRRHAHLESERKRLQGSLGS
jgi:N-formylglutamate amidohydrolase